MVYPIQIDMSIEYKRGSIFDSDAMWLVNPVNTVGVMGAGLAKQFKERYPEAYYHYKIHTSQGYWERPVLKGDVRLVYHGKKREKTIICLPTKEHWRNPSTLDGIKRAVSDLAIFCKYKEIKKVAVPLLGCGLGGLQWKDVKPIMEDAFDGHTTVFEVWRRK